MLTVGELMDLYERDYLPTKAKKTQCQQRHMYNRIRADLGDIPVDQLTPMRLRHWRDTLRQHYQPGSARAYLNSLAAALTVAVNELEILDASPMLKVSKPAQSPGRTRVLSQEEQARLLAACQAVRAPALYPAVVLLLYTGCRKDEIRCLRWDEVDFEHRCLRILHTKNGDRRLIPLIGEALAVLRLRYETRRLNIPWVFPRYDGKGAIDLNRTWQRVKKQVGLDDFRMHDLRHTAASRLAMSGASLLEIASILGHRQMSMVQRYSHFSGGHIESVLERMAQHYPVETPRPEDLGPEESNSNPGAR